MPCCSSSALHSGVFSFSSCQASDKDFFFFNSLAEDFSCNGCEAAWWLLTCRLETRQPTGGFSSAAGGAGPLSATTLLSDRRDHRRPAIGTAAAAATSSPPETCLGEAQSWAARASEESRSGKFQDFVEIHLKPNVSLPFVGPTTLDLICSLKLHISIKCKYTFIKSTNFHP